MRPIKISETRQNNNKKNTFGLFSAKIGLRIQNASSEFSKSTD